MKRPFPDACIIHWLILEDIKLFFLYRLLSGLHLCFSAYKRRKARESKQGSKNSIVEIEATLKIQRRIEKTTATLTLTHQETEFYPCPAQQKYFAFVDGSAVAYRYPRSSESPQVGISQSGTAFTHSISMCCWAQGRGRVRWFKAT